MTRRQGRYATIPPPPQEGLSERELAFYTAVKQNLEMLTSGRTSGAFPAQDSVRLDRVGALNRNRSGTGLDPGGAPTPLEQRLIELNERLEELRNVTLPELEETLRLLNEVTLPELERDLANLNEVKLPNLEQDLNTLNTVALPDLQDDLDDLNDDLDTLNTVTLPTLQQELNDVLPITETKIANDSISAPKLQGNSVIAGKIAANAIVANEIAGDTITGNMVKAGTIKANNIATGTITALQIDSNTITTNEIAAGTITAFNIDSNTITTNEIASGTITAFNIDSNTITSNEIATGTIKAINIDSGTITSNEIFGDTLDVIAANTGTLTSNLIRTSASGQRLELTDPNTDPDYAIWIGDNNKEDSNAVFYVKHNGEAFISKNEFDISDGGIITGAFSNGGGTVNGSSNSLTAPSGAVEVGEGGIYFDVNIFFKAFRSRNNIQSSSCVIPGVSGALLLERANNSSFTSGVTTVNNITFSGQGTRFWVDEPFPPGPLCDQRIQFENTKTFVDNPTAGTYYYRLSYSTWQSSLFGNEVSENVLYATFTSSAA